MGATYGVHWPHSAIGASHTPHQYQYPFYDGVFCGWTQGVADAIAADDQVLANAVGVWGQTFVIVKDDNYYLPDLIHGADWLNHWH